MTQCMRRAGVVVGCWFFSKGVKVRNVRTSKNFVQSTLDVRMWTATSFIICTDCVIFDSCEFIAWVDVKNIWNWLIGFHLFLFATKYYGADDSGKKNQPKSITKKEKEKQLEKIIIFLFCLVMRLIKDRNTASGHVSKKRIPNSSLSFLRECFSSEMFCLSFIQISVLTTYLKNF